MAHLILMPRLTDTMHEGEINYWYKEEGDSVSKGDDLFAVETDKAVIDVEAGESGILLRIFPKLGESVKVGDVVVIIGKKGEDITSLLPKANEQQSDFDDRPIEKNEKKKSAIIASPVAKRMAKELNIDLALVTGTGQDGLITKKNLETFLDERKGHTNIECPVREIEERIPIKGVLKAMAEKMTMSANIPQATTFAEVDVSDLVDLSKEHSIKITPFIIKATKDSLLENRKLNSTLNRDEIILWRQVNLGVSVSTPRGLVVPVIKQAEKLSLHQIGEELASLAKKAVDNRLTLDDVSHSTFTITNSGVFGSLFFTPRINPPESAILGVGKIMKQPVVRDEQVVIRSMMILSLSYDHRIIDGKTAVTFLQNLKSRLEDPIHLL